MFINRSLGRLSINPNKLNSVFVAPRISDLQSRSNWTSSCSLENLIRAKDRKQLSFADIATHIGRPESWTAGLFFGKYHPNPTELEKLYGILDLKIGDEENLPIKIDDRHLSTNSTSSSFLGSNSTLFPVIEEILLLPTSEDLLVSAHGWIKTIRKQKKLSFIELVDGSTHQHLQIVAESNDSKDLETGCAIQAIGNLISSRGGEQAKELKARRINLVGSCSASEYPLQKKLHSPAFLRKIPHLRIRTPQISALMRIRSAMIRETSSFLHRHHFFRTETPIITFNDCEGAGEVFSVRPENQLELAANLTNQLSPLTSCDQEFFGRQAFLTVSGQLHLEALSVGLGRVYSFGPAFRAEKSQTNRHLAEFWMLEAELSFIESLECLTEFLENLIKSIIHSLYQPNSPSILDLKSLDAPIQPYFSAGVRWPRIEYCKAIDLIQSHNQKSTAGGNISLPPINWGQPLASEHEKWLAGTYAQGPIFVTDYPNTLKPFYMRKTVEENVDGGHRKLWNTESQPTVACFDLLVPGIGEIAGGSLREPNLIKLKESMVQKGLMDSDEIVGKFSQMDQYRSDDKFQWYFDLRKFGNSSSGGFGIGWERLLSWLTGMENVRECISFPRVNGSGCC